MAFIKRLRNQNWLFPPTIADLIEEDHICRLVADVVESIDFESIEGRYDGPGSPGYHPKVNLKRIWTIKSQTKAIGVNSTKNGRNNQSSLKNLCSRIKGVWSQILSSFSKGLSIYPL